MKLEDDQKYVIRELLKFPKDVQVLGGRAGTGKSTVVKHLAEALPNFAVCAFTGKAADVLRRKGISRAATIHSLIYTPYEDTHGNIHFRLADSVVYEGFLVDEGSMVGKELFEDLCFFKKPIIVVGDHGQLEPIGSDYSLMKNTDYALEKIHRNAGEIAYFAEHIRQGYRAASWQYKSSGKKIEFITRREADQHLLKVDQVICAFNKTRSEINIKVKKSMDHISNTPCVGDRVMCLRNHRAEGLFNGMQAKVVKIIKKNKMYIETEEGIELLVKYNPKTFNQIKYDFDYDGPHPFDFCWGTTCHKCQGSEWNQGLVIEQQCDLWSQPRWSYTAASRFKEGIKWVSV